MVQIIPRQPTRLEGTMQALGQGIGGFAQGAQALSNALRSKQERETLSQKFGDEFRNIRNPDLQRRLLEGKLEQQNQSAKLKGEYAADEENYSKIKNAFGEKFADIWLASPVGARTELTRAALEARARGIDLDQMLGLSKPQRRDELPQKLETSSEPEETIFNELKNLVSSEDEGLLPEEKIARGKERYTTGLKEYQEAGTKLRSMQRDKERIGILEDLEKSKKLPKGLGRINVDKEGNLRLPFAGTAESQRYVKTLNEFSAGAKDTFGSRVTNFDLTQYLKRYPTLLNTSEGRQQLYEQMRLVNQINSIYYKNLKKVYDEAGGVRKIDSDVAERLAEELSGPQTNALVSKFKEIGEFQSLPNASEFKGKKIRNKETGEIFVSDGTNWIPQ